MKAEQHLRRQTEEVVFRTIDQCLEEIRDPFFGYKLRDDYKSHVRFLWSPKAYVSRGGGDSSAGLIKLTLYHYTPQWWQKLFCFEEYPHVQDHPVIGSFITKDWDLVVKALTCHEMAHAVQFAQTKDHPDYTSLQVGHGEGWQRIYGLMRGPLVNMDILASGGVIGLKNYRISVEEAERLLKFDLTPGHDKKKAIHLLVNEHAEMLLGGGVSRKYGEPLCGSREEINATNKVQRTEDLHLDGCPECLEIVRRFK